MIQTTVVIPNYNGDKFIEKCLDSLYACEDDSFQVIVIDNHSEDHSGEWLRQNQDRYGYEFHETEKNLGFCGAVNIGFKYATTKYVILLNNDTVVRPGFVSALTDCLNKDERIFSASAKMLSMNNPTIIDDAGDNYSALGWAYGRGKGKSSEKYKKSCEIFFSCGGAAIYIREVANSLGLFDENHFAYLEDADIGYRARIAGYKNVYEPKAEVLHAGSAVSGSRYNEFKVRLSSRNNVYLALKNMPLLQLIINLPFLLAGFAIKTVFFYKKGFGKIYVKGMIEGLKLYLSEDGQNKKVKFYLTNLPHYVKIQILLWKNTIRV